MPHKFDIRNIEGLNNPKRLGILDLQKVISHFRLEGNITLVDIGTGAGIFAEAFLKLLLGARFTKLVIPCPEVESSTKC